MNNSHKIVLYETRLRGFAIRAHKVEQVNQRKTKHNCLVFVLYKFQFRK